MRQAGILLAVSSLPSRHGIGDFGPEAYAFVRQLRRTGSSLWQVLPLNPLGYGNSPYQPYSSKAMDELYVSLELLVKQGLLKRAPRYNMRRRQVDYDAVRAYKEQYLRLAFSRFAPKRAYQQFVRANPWVYNYAVFVTLKKKNGMRLWLEWPRGHRDWIKDKKADLSAYAADIAYEMFIQFTLYRQWQALKRYANRRGIAIVGDIPIYVGIDSEDVWSHQEQFLLDEDGYPTHIAGVPPDYFSVTGQRWGNPLYDWNVMEKDGFAFWLDRLGYNAQMFDYIRVDHFRAFDTYWKIPASCPTAVEGAWIEAPGYAFFDAMFAAFPSLKILAEDLGDLRPQVLTLRDHYRLPGMKIVQFSFDFAKNPVFKPYVETNMAVYPGTHDNQTTRGWYLGLKDKDRKKVRRYLASGGYRTRRVAAGFVALTMASAPDIAVIPMQDVLGLDDRARMNTPGTIGAPNWIWKMTSLRPFSERRTWLRKLIADSGRGTR